MNEHEALKQLEWWLQNDVPALPASIMCVAMALGDLAYQVKYLGNGDAATSMGAIEALGAVFKEALGGISSTLDGIASSVSGLNSVPFSPPSRSPENE